MRLKKVVIPKRYNYIACFISLTCNYKCHYCINWFEENSRGKKLFMSGKMWIEGLNRLICPKDMPVTLQGGEPGLHPNFFEIIKNIKPELNIDILTNLSFDTNKFIKELNPSRLSRNAPYPNIRVSYHPQYMQLNTIIKKTLKLQKEGFSIGIHGILHPELKNKILDAQKECLDLGIDFRTKEFLGTYNGKLYGAYLHPDAVCSNSKKSCLCRTSELLIGNNGDVFGCHHDLYNNFSPLANLLDPDLVLNDTFRQCNQYGDCNPCDIKIKNNRFQINGHTSVEIKDIKAIRNKKWINTELTATN